MTKDEALKLALEALESGVTTQNSRLDWVEYDSELVEQAITAIKEALAQPEPNYKKALEVWLDKTEWVQETVKPHELGMHRADVLKQRIEATLAQPEQDWIERERAVGYREGHRAALVQRTWVGLTEKDICEAAVKSQEGISPRNDTLRFAIAIEAKLRSKNS